MRRTICVSESQLRYSGERQFCDALDVRRYSRQHEGYRQQYSRSVNHKEPITQRAGARMCGRHRARDRGELRLVSVFEVDLSMRTRSRAIAGSNEVSVGAVFAG